MMGGLGIAFLWLLFGVALTFAIGTIDLTTTRRKWERQSGTNRNRTSSKY